MAETNSSGSGDGLRLLSALGGVLVVCTLGAGLARAIDNTPGQVHDVQITNQQLWDQLDDARPVDNLIVDPKAETVTFDSVDSHGDPEVCTGQYEGSGKDARMVGSVTCAQTTSVG